jgi:hypothetical protein
MSLKLHGYEPGAAASFRDIDTGVQAIKTAHNLLRSASYRLWPIAFERLGAITPAFWNKVLGMKVSSDEGWKLLKRRCGSCQ